MWPSRGAEHFWLIAITGWVALVSAGAVWIHRHPRQPPQKPPAAATTAGCRGAAAKERLPGVIARRSLARNHWIGEADLDWATATGDARQPDLLWRYSSCPVKTGERVIRDETLALPDVDAVAAGRLTHLLPLASDARLRAALNAGSIVDVWEGATPLARELPVLAVQCRSRSAPAVEECWAIVAVAQDDAARLQKANAAEFLIVSKARS